MTQSVANDEYVEAEYLALKGDLQESLEKLRQLGEIQRRFSELKKSQKSYAALLEDSRAQLSGQKERAEELLARLAQGESEQKDALAQLADATIQLEHIDEARLEEFRNGFDTSLKVLQTDVRKQHANARRDIEKRFAEVALEIDAKIAEREQVGQAALKRLDAEVITRESLLTEKFESSFKVLLTDVEKQHRNLRRDVEKKLDESTYSIDARLTMQEIAESESLNRIEKASRAFEAIMHHKLGELEGQLASVGQFAGQLESEQVSNREAVDSSLKRLQREVNASNEVSKSKIDSLEARLMRMRTVAFAFLCLSLASIGGVIYLLITQQR